MSHPAILQKFLINTRSIEIFVPDPVLIAEAYKNKKVSSTSLYWAKVWPSAVGLCIFLQDNLHYIQDKNVLELAAGPGLPGIFLAPFAQQVCISDIEPQAVALMQQSVLHHQLKNISCRVIDWKHLQDVSMPEVVLLSDINYEPAQFEQLLQVIHYFLDKQCTIVLSTPHRLMAKEFINQLLIFCKQQTAIEVELEMRNTSISVFVLKK
jgi:predicted nicotinamide N-methyase